MPPPPLAWQPLQLNQREQPLALATAPTRSPRSGLARRRRRGRAPPGVIVRHAHDCTAVDGGRRLVEVGGPRARTPAAARRAPTRRRVHQRRMRLMTRSARVAPARRYAVVAQHRVDLAARARASARRARRAARRRRAARPSRCRRSTGRRAFGIARRGRARARRRCRAREVARPAAPRARATSIVAVARPPRPSRAAGSA